MGIGISIFLIAVGAILFFAVSATVAGLNVSSVGVILMIIGALGLVVSFILLNMARERVGGGYERTVVRDTRTPAIDTRTPVVSDGGTTVVREEVR